MAEYIDKNATVGILEAMSRSTDCECIKKRLEKAAKRVSAIPAADVVPVTRCKDCKHSTLPSELTQRYGKPGTLTCHNMHAPSNRRNVGNNDFCSYGERKDGES